MYQYSDYNQHYLALFYVDANELSAEGYADNLKTALEDRGATNISVTPATIGEFQGYKVSSHYEALNKWLYCYTFETNDGKTRYISLEGPEQTHEYYDIYQTFTLN